MIILTESSNINNRYNKQKKLIKDVRICLIQILKPVHSGVCFIEYILYFKKLNNIVWQNTNKENINGQFIKDLMGKIKKQKLLILVFFPHLFAFATENHTTYNR